jgi:hypothetical protein
MRQDCARQRSFTAPATLVYVDFDPENDPIHFYLRVHVHLLTGLPWLACGDQGTRLGFFFFFFFI